MLQGHYLYYMTIKKTYNSLTKGGCSWTANWLEFYFCSTVLGHFYANLAAAERWGLICNILRPPVGHETETLQCMVGALTPRVLLFSSFWSKTPCTLE